MSVWLSSSFICFCMKNQRHSYDATISNCWLNHHSHIIFRNCCRCHKIFVCHLSAVVIVCGFVLIFHPWHNWKDIDFLSQDCFCIACLLKILALYLCSRMLPIFSLMLVSHQTVLMDLKVWLHCAGYGKWLPPFCLALHFSDFTQFKLSHRNICE